MKRMYVDGPIDSLWIPVGFFHGVSRVLKLKHNTATVALAGLRPLSCSQFLGPAARTSALCGALTLDVGIRGRQSRKFGLPSS